MDSEVKKNSTNKYEIWQPFLLSVMMAIGILIGYKMNDKSDNLVTALDSDKKIEIGRVEEILRLIETRYVDHIDRNVLIENAIEGMLDELDPHSIYLQKEFLADINDNMDGNFKGIGIESHMLNDTAVIIKVVPNSPASKAGLKQFDKITKVNNNIVAGVKMPFDSLKHFIRKSKEVVNLEILQHSSNKSLIKNIKVEDIPIPSADISYLLNDSVGFIQITQFSSTTYNEFMKAFEDLVDKNKIKHLVLDLRGNPGGYLPQATKIVNQLIREKKQLIVSTKDKNGNSEEYYTTGNSFFNIDKIAILVDEYSASGSEVIAGAIQDHDRGIIIGHTTYGKGLVQEQFNLSNGSAIRLTTARFYTPSGRNIQKDHESTDTTTSNKRTQEIKKYTTLNLKREVLSQSAIKPDFIINGNDNGNRYENYMLRNKILDFVLSYYLKGTIHKSAALDYQKLTKEFISVNKINTTSTSEFEITEVLKNEIQYLSSNGNDQAVSKSKSKNDEYINAALKYVRGEIGLK